MADFCVSTQSAYTIPLSVRIGANTGGLITAHTVATHPPLFDGRLVLSGALSRESNHYWDATNSVAKEAKPVFSTVLDSLVHATLIVLLSLSASC